MTMLDIEAGALTARIVPDCGGIVASLRWHRPDGRLQDVLHAPRGAIASRERPSMFGSWAMLPFANRAFGCVVDDGTSRFTVPANDGLGNIHGFSWQSAWDVVEAGRSAVVLEHRREEGPDPYRYVARQTITLDERGLTIAMAITNLAATTLPYGLGHHPWFDCAPDTRLAMTVEGALVFGEAFRATGMRALVHGGPYAQSETFATGAETAWSFLGWDGIARIETPSAGLAIMLSASESLRCPVVWSPAGADFFCVEPQSHAIGAPSEEPARMAAPLMRLAPQETLQGWLRIAPEAL